MVSIEVLNENRRVIEKGSGEIAVHCPRCDHLNKVTVNLADQRKLIADLNKKNIRTRKANDLQAKADRYRSLGAKWSGDLRGAREIDAVNSFNAAMTDRPRLYGQSDLTTNFSTKCRNCGNIADDY
jgi:phage FluMu protein Com